LGSLDDVLVHASENLHVVMTSRAAVRLPRLEKLRLLDQVAELGDRDLRLDPAEVAMLLRALGVELPPGDRDRLFERTEGWAAGVQLMGLALRDGADVEATLDVVPEPIARYLLDEVVAREDDGVRQFLYETSMLDVLNPRTADRVGDRPDSDVLLEYLASRCVFVERVDEIASEYRYHPLFREVLQREFGRRDPAGYLALRRNAPPVGARLALQLAATTIQAGDTDATRDWVRRAERELGRMRSVGPYLLGLYTTLRYMLSYADGELHEAARLAGEARRLLESASPGEWMRMRVPLGHVRFLGLMGHYRRARSLHDRCVRTLIAPLPGDVLTLSSGLATVALAEGELGEALQLAEQAVEAAMQVGAPEFLLSEPRYVRGAVLMERDELDAAEVELVAALELAEKQRCVHLRVMPRAALAWLAHARGDCAAAKELLNDARELTRGPGPLRETVDYVAVRLALLDGQLGKARNLVESLTGSDRTVLLARLLAAEGQCAAALTHVGASRSSSRRGVIDNLLLRAQCASTIDQRIALVRAGLELAEPVGAIRTFVIEAAWILPAIRELVATWPTPYAGRLADAVAAVPPTIAGNDVEAILSPREREIWRYLSTSMSMREIAETLYLSTNTVKTHARNIYRKLSVATRAQAVARGNPSA
jgi:LuxR family maltose regulon positive regulatory protein